MRKRWVMAARRGTVPAWTGAGRFGETVVAMARPLVQDVAVSGREVLGAAGHQALEHGGEPGRLLAVAARGRRRPGAS
ncbi:hypothetical protein [Streptomyces hesseae]|uniref:Uncharacterized protein n=1 Tax=Streptomyces hesseae TaxID=3075519 RepID=A0ABU2SHB8_9ACTN|nr:hypothetical protein [Streptomyces sp. DSM 40473]MDT0448371.1 hypothetical protein [Streptomyces sp. DSM 40473]